MRYFSEDKTCINVECEKCKRVLKINKNDCEKNNSGYNLTKDCKCSCGNVFNYISGKGTNNYLDKKPKSKTTNNTNKNIVAMFILVALIVFGVKSCSSSLETSSQQRTQDENNAFQQQMQQSPSTWNQEQKDRYNNFMKWDQEQKQK